MWLDRCYIQFSNQDFLSVFDNLPQVALSGTNNVTGNQTVFYQDVTQLMSELTSWAINNSTKSFATGEVTNFSREIPSIYGLLQCTPNMPKSQCQVRFCSGSVMDQCLQLFILVHTGDDLYWYKYLGLHQLCNWSCWDNVWYRYWIEVLYHYSRLPAKITTTSTIAGSNYYSRLCQIKFLVPVCRLTFTFL